MSTSGKNAGSTYLEERRVQALFEALTAGLVHTRPEQPIDFLLQCLDKAQQIGHRNIFWDSFLPPVPTASRLGPVQDVLQRTANTDDRVRLLEIQNNARDEKLPTPTTKEESNEGITDQYFDIEKTEGTKETKKQKNANEKSRKPTKRKSFITKSKTLNNDDEEEEGELPEEGEDTRHLLHPAHRPQAMEVRMRELYSGRLQHIPKIPTNTVRVFLSSTFSDFRAERNILPKEAYPELQAFCRERGLEFQVIDMRWGVTDEMLNDHQVTELCLREIEHCQQVSRGPSFVTLIGNRYGYRPFPSVIAKDEFEILMGQDLPEITKIRALLRDWFVEDKNIVPPAYVLQPIVKNLEHFNDESNKEKYEADRKAWSQISQHLQTYLAELSKAAFSKGEITQDQMSKYHISVTEAEIETGLIKADQPRYKSMCFIRNIEGLTSFLNKSNTGRFIDIVDDNGSTKLDESAQTQLKSLVEKKIEQKLPIPREHKYNIVWRGTNLEDSTEDEHSQYLRTFCSQFISNMKQMIEESTENESVKGNSSGDDGNELFHDIVHHAIFAKNRLELFCGRKQELAQVQQLMTQAQENHPPIVIQAPSGHGKTSLMAKCAQMIPEWFAQDTIVALRFLGTSPQCSTIKDTLISVISQLCALFDLALPHKEVLDKMSDVRVVFNNILKRIGEKHREKKVVIVLDSIDQLYNLYGAYRFSWLPRKLPENVYILISILSDFESLIKACRNRITTSSSFISLEPLSPNTAKEITETFIALKKRTLTPEHKEFILKAFSKNDQPLFLKLILDQAVKWHSYTTVESIHLPSTVRIAIENLLERIELKYGEVFVRHALSYLSCGQRGVADIEMDDVLSCDDAVLCEVYRYHDPPLKGTVRIPALLWVRLRTELKEYLTEKQVDRKTVITWFHRQFFETTESHYLLDASHRKQMHSNMAQIFLQTEGIRRTIVLTQRKGKVVENADRRVTPQPLEASNVRKLNVLPYHLFHGAQYEELTSSCLLDYTFLVTKLKAVGITALFLEYKEMVAVETLRNNPSVMLMKNFIELTYDALHLDSSLFSFFVIERLEPFMKEDIYRPLSKILDQCRAYLSETKLPMLLPTNLLNLTSLDSPNEFSQLVGFTGEVSSNGEVAVCLWKEQLSNQHRIVVFDLIAREVITTTPLSKESQVVISPDNVVFVVFNEKKLCFYELYTGEKIAAFDILDQAYDQITVRSMELSVDGKWLVFALKLGKPSKIRNGEAWQTQGYLYCVDMESLNTDKFIIKSVKNKSKRHYESILFIDQSRKVAALKRDAIQIFSLPDLEHVETFIMSSGYLMGGLGYYVPEHDAILTPVVYSNGCRGMIYNCSNNTHELSPLLHTNTTNDLEGQAEGFGIVPKHDLSEILIGTNSQGDIKRTRLWIWEPSNNTAEKIVIQNNLGRIAKVLLVLPNWQHAIIGYKSGDITVNSITGKYQQLIDIHAHGNVINTIKMYNSGSNLITIASDQTLKLWNLQRLLDGKDEEETKPTEDSEDGVTPLDTNEQVLSFQVTNNHVVTVSQRTADGPRFWDLGKGILDVEMTEAHSKHYVKAIEGYPQMQPVKYHGVVELINQFVIFQRKRRSGFFFYVAESYDSCSAIAYDFFEESYFSLACAELMGCKPTVYIVRDGVLEIRTLPGLALVKKITLPKISEEITNLESKNSKRRLGYYKLGITLDGRYFFICNTYTNPRQGKYLDLFDVKAMVYKGRTQLPTTTSWKLMEDSFTYLVIPNDETVSPGIYRPSFAAQISLNDMYICPIYIDKSYGIRMSNDFTLGVETMRDCSMHIWDVNAIKEIGVLQGHTSEVNCASFSQDNSYLASGSFDNTVRLWSMKTMATLCLFHLHGNVANILITPNREYIVARYYSAPQRTRAAILKIHNVENSEK